MKKIFLVILALFFILIPLVRLMVHIPLFVPSMQWVPFAVINKYTCQIYFINFVVYLIPGALYCGYTQEFTIKQFFPKLFPYHLLGFFLVCLLTKLSYYLLRIGAFDISTVFVQTIAILAGFIGCQLIVIFIKQYTK